MKNSKHGKIFRFSALLALAFIIIAAPVAVLAQANKVISVAEGEIVEGNFIRAGEVIDIQGAVNGDVIVAGNSITIAGDVAGDVIAAASTIRILGEVGGSVRVAGNSIEVNNNVAHNVWAVGATVSIGQDAQIGWDVFAAGASVEIRGEVQRSLWLTGSSLLVAAPIGGDIHAAIDKEGQLTLNPQSQVEGNVTYRAERDEQFVADDGSSIAGEISRKDLGAPTEQDIANFFNVTYVIWQIFTVFSLLIIGLVFITLVPRAALMIKDEMVNKPWPSLGWGVLFLIGVPIAIILLAVTLIGIPLALMLIPAYVIAFYIAKVFAAFGLGLLILDKTSKAEYKRSLVWPLVLGLVVLVLIKIIPFVGMLVAFLLTLWALGAILRVKKEILKEYR